MFLINVFNLENTNLNLRIYNYRKQTTPYSMLVVSGIFLGRLQSACEELQICNV